MVTHAVSVEPMQQLLQRMDDVSRDLEKIVSGEQEAVRFFDAEALLELTEVRRHCHQELASLEERCREIMRQADVPDDLSLEAFIDLYLAADVAPGLQALRRKLYERMAKLAEANEEQSIRFRAAYEVTSHVLRDIGVLEPRTTYGPGGAL